MGKAERERLNRALGAHLNTIHETLQVLDRTADSSLEKVKWEDVVKMGDEVSKQATVVGMLCTGAAPEAKGLEENMVTYFNMLQGLLLLSHGSTVGAGSTLSSVVHAAVKQVVDASFKLWMDVVSSYGSSKKDGTLSETQLVGAVWEACSALKKTPATNITAIGRAMTQAALSIKDVLREMKELKPEGGPADEPSNYSSNPEENKSNDTNDSSDDELGSDLSLAEMKIAQSTINLVSQTLALIKELIRSITGLIKLESSNSSSNFVDTLERLLKLCQDISLQVDELGASLYPPQELSSIMTASEKISTDSVEILAELQALNSLSDSFLQCINSVKNAVKQQQAEIKSSSPDD
uniref:Uncharacterized protein n=1 Tax=Kalanchoe fedtschenkoi TaxID=63787 RepID=A0A7N0VBV7_KALFE